MSVSFNRLKELRQLLINENINGYILPYGDEFQNEYLPEATKRFLFITGLDSSAGLCLILENAAAVFVDGRYLLKANQTIDLQSFKVIPWTSENLQNFLQEEAPKGSTLGYDPWTLTDREYSSFKDLGDSLGFSLKSLSYNLVDRIWKNRPSLPSTAVEEYPISYAGISWKEKIGNIARLLQQEKAEVCILCGPESINWLLNIRARDIACIPIALCRAFVFQDGTVSLFIEKERVPESLLNSWKDHVTFLPPPSFEEETKKLASKNKKIWYDPTATSMAICHLFENASTAPLRKQDPCLLPKAIKNSVEIKNIQETHIKDGRALTRFMAKLSTLIHEGKILNEVEASNLLLSYRQQEEGFIEPSFPTISSVGSNGAIIHYHPSLETAGSLVSGALYLLDSGGQYLGGTTDVTRTFFLGEGTPSPFMKQAYTAVLKGHIALAQATFPKGTTGHQLDILARQHLWKLGLDYDHATGHGVGCFLNVHEGPQTLSKRPNSTPLQAGMIIANEPGYYKANSFGIRIENVFLIKEKLPSSSADKERIFYELEVLTLAPLDMKLINWDMLTPDEKEWIQSYHKKVFETLASTLSEQEKKWLETYIY